MSDIVDDGRGEGPLPKYASADIRFVGVTIVRTGTFGGSRLVCPCGTRITAGSKSVKNDGQTDRQTDTVKW